MTLRQSQIVQDLLWYLTSAYMKGVYGWAGVRYLITKFSWMDSLPNFVTYGAPLRARFARAPYNFTLDNSNHAISAWQFGKKKPCTKVRNFEFVSKQLCQFVYLYFFVTPVKIQCPSLYVNQALFINCIPSPSIGLFLYFRLNAPDNRNFYRFT